MSETHISCHFNLFDCALSESPVKGGKGFLQQIEDSKPLKVMWDEVCKSRSTERFGTEIRRSLSLSQVVHQISGPGSSGLMMSWELPKGRGEVTTPGSWVHGLFSSTFRHRDTLRNTFECHKFGKNNTSQPILSLSFYMVRIRTFEGFVLYSVISKPQYLLLQEQQMGKRSCQRCLLSVRGLKVFYKTVPSYPVKRPSERFLYWRLQKTALVGIHKVEEPFISTVVRVYTKR